MSERPPEFVPLDIPPGVPIARPVLMTSAPEGALLGYATGQRATTLRAPVGTVRALLELLALIPAGIFGSGVAYAVFHAVPGLSALTARDERLYYLGATIITATFITAAAFVMLRLDRQSARDIGWTAREFLPNVALGLVAFVVCYVTLSVLAFLIFIFFPELVPQTSQAQKGIEESIPPLPIIAMLPVMLFVAIWEEIVFRGFLLSRLKVILKSWWVVIPVAGAIFGSVHLYQGPLAVGLVAGLGIIMGVLLVGRKSLVPGIAFHLAHNLVMLAILRTISTNWR